MKECRQKRRCQECAEKHGVESLGSECGCDNCGDLRFNLCTMAIKISELEDKIKKLEVKP